MTDPEVDGHAGTQLILQARVAHEADGVDRDLQNRVLELRRAFLRDPRFVQQTFSEHR